MRGLSLVAASGGHSSSRCAGLSLSRPLLLCGAQAPDTQAQQLWLTGPVAPWHVGSSQTRARTHVPCIGRQILNHCATREAPEALLYYIFWKPLTWMIAFLFPLNFCVAFLLEWYFCGFIRCEIHLWLWPINGEVTLSLWFFFHGGGKRGTEY